jgi:lactate dehydrogenase-like 2-hydroxyacid dehydrogenase
VKPNLLVVTDLPSWSLEGLSYGYTVHHAPDTAAREALLAESGLENFRAFLTNGSVGMAGLPITDMTSLELICVSGAGYDQVDLAAAQAQGIAVTNGPSTNDTTAADHAFALILSVARGITEVDRAIRRGDWAASNRPGGWDGLRAPRPLVTGKRLGIVGLGNIGQQIARRAVAGFDMSIAYHNRRPAPEIAYTYHSDVQNLAADCEFLLLTCPGGPETRHMVNDSVLKALGPQGFLINAARGSVVDTKALTKALCDGTIAGAALDVFETEPYVPADLLAAPNLIVTPHLAGRAPEAIQAFMKLVRANLDAHFSGQPLITPILQGGTTR